MVKFERFLYTTIIDRHDFLLRGSYEIKGNEIKVDFPNSELVDELFYNRHEIGTISFVTQGEEKTFRISSDTVIRNGSQVTLYTT